MSNFAFLAAEFPTVHEAAVEAERQAGVSPTAAAFFAGKTVELAVKWAFRNDPGLKLPYQDNIAALLHEPSFRRAAGASVAGASRASRTEPEARRRIHIYDGRCEPAADIRERTCAPGT